MLPAPGVVVGGTQLPPPWPSPLCASANGGMRAWLLDVAPDRDLGVNRCEEALGRLWRDRDGRPPVVRRREARPDSPRDSDRELRPADPVVCGRPSRRMGLAACAATKLRSRLSTLCKPSARAAVVLSKTDVTP